MLPRVAEMISELIPSEVRDIASRWQGEIRVHWDTNARFWRDLLIAAEARDDETVADLHLHAKLLLLGFLIRHRSEKPIHNSLITVGLKTIDV
jgi:hypothetical protein